MVIAPSSITPVEFESRVVVLAAATACGEARRIL